MFHAVLETCGFENNRPQRHADSSQTATRMKTDCGQKRLPFSSLAQITQKEEESQFANEPKSISVKLLTEGKQKLVLSSLPPKSQT